MKRIKETEGGVLFIDEAYRLSVISGKYYGKESIETIMSKMTENPNNLVTIPVFYSLSTQRKCRNS